ncbi:MAG: threonine synthase [Clostridia bacterium]|nr:threonine synthase [Clostridia bacterium]
MQFISTRGSSPAVSASEAILNGLAPDGGLYVPEYIPSVDRAFVESLCPLTYAERAAKVLSLYLSDYTHSELLEYARAAYSRFETPDTAAPTVRLTDNTYVLELYHGPTCAFKDMALTILPHLLTAAMRKNGISDKVMILVATSGDTGKAALAGFADVPGTAITVFYPEDGVSAVQKLQMITQSGENVSVFAVKGNFDDAQNGVKRIFSDRACAERLAARGIRLSSANSINWGRLVPQIVYYISAYCDLLNQNAVAYGDIVDICVPTGNFGNILAAFYAKKMGVPLGRLICASNENNVLTEFLQTGRYDRLRDFKKTSSPSMDILISSNVERLLAELSGHNGSEVAGMMSALVSEGSYTVSEDLLRSIRELFAAGNTDDAGTYEAIRATYSAGWLSDTHTAVALKVLENYRARTGEDRITVVASTASPFKFAIDVNAALEGSEVRPDLDGGTEILDTLSAKTGVSIPEPLSGLDSREKRFKVSVEPADMLSAMEGAF